ncbi:MAG: DUF4331 family protein [Candidatus Eremiobacteraeota bacterium]|nr:DUF4331 family protein [Candidatus Eremiobacteraeota bacterium]MBC5826359.1 DUF4331 family protein [Candidatus Eremiobacteraeota bacterium]
MKTKTGFIAASLATLVGLAAAVTLYSVGPVRSSDHQDSPSMLSRPGADITDAYVWPGKTPDSVVLALNVHPLIPAGMGRSTYFDPGVMYQFKIDNVGDHMEHLVLQFQAKGVGPGQTIAMYGPAKPNMTGTLSTFVSNAGDAPYNQTTTLPNGVKFFAGPREDPFYFDLSQFFKIVPDRNASYHVHGNSVPAPSATCFRKPGIDFLSANGFNVLSLVVEMPRSMLAPPGGRPGRINVWTSTSVQERGSGAGEYTQIERWGRPAIKEAFQTFDEHDSTNRSAPTSDRTLPRAIKSFMMAQPPFGAGRSEAVANAMVATLIPDEMEADLSASGPARYLAVETNGKSGLPVAVVRAVPVPFIYGIKRALGDPYRHFGGRDPGSPVIDLDLGAIFGSLIPKLGLAPEDGHETPCLTSDNVTPSGKHFTADFPYLGAPR